MGFRVQLIAVSGKEPQAIHREFGVVATGQCEEIPESPFLGAVLSSGAYLLYINDQDKIVPDDEVFARLSRGASLIACYANETVMNSYACAWLNWVECWSVFHDAKQDSKHLETSGALPPEMQTIRDRLFGRQENNDGVDFILTSRLSCSLSGRHQVRSGHSWSGPRAMGDSGAEWMSARVQRFLFFKKVAQGEKIRILTRQNQNS